MLTRAAKDRETRESTVQYKTRGACIISRSSTLPWCIRYHISAGDRPLYPPHWTQQWTLKPKTLSAGKVGTVQYPDLQVCLNFSCSKVVEEAASQVERRGRSLGSESVSDMGRAAHGQSKLPLHSTEHVIWSIDIDQQWMRVVAK